MLFIMLLLCLSFNPPTTTTTRAHDDYEKNGSLRIEDVESDIDLVDLDSSTVNVVVDASNNEIDSTEIELEYDEYDSNYMSSNNNDDTVSSNRGGGGFGVGIVDELKNTQSTTTAAANIASVSASNSNSAWGSAPITQTFQPTANAHANNSGLTGSGVNANKFVDTVGGDGSSSSSGLDDVIDNFPLHSPPEGLSLSAHVVVSTDDGLSYFASNPLPVIPFTDCGPVMGSLTEQIPLRQMKFRHFPAMAETSWGTLSDTEPQLVVCLHPLEVIVSGNNQESQIFQAGDVILFEDQIGKGHKLRAPITDNKRDKSFEDQTVSVLSFTLPHYKTSSSVLGFNKALSSTHDCSQKVNTGVLNSMPDEDLQNSIYAYQAPEQGFALFGAPIRQIALGVVGLGISSAFTLKITQFIPAKFSVRFGQLCMVGAGISASILFYDILIEDNLRKAIHAFKRKKQKYFLIHESAEHEDINQP